MHSSVLVLFSLAVICFGALVAIELWDRSHHRTAFETNGADHPTEPGRVHNHRKH